MAANSHGKPAGSGASTAVPPATESRMLSRRARGAAAGIAGWQRGHFTYPSGTATPHFGHGEVVAGSALTRGS
jgi:hypothetical protein